MSHKDVLPFLVHKPRISLIFALIGFSWLTLGLMGSAVRAGIKVDPFGEAAEKGVKIRELNKVWVVIYGSSALDVREVRKKSLWLGTRDSLGTRARKTKKRDVNDDGFLDLLARFKVDGTGLREAEQRDAVLTVGLKDGVTVFTFYDTSLGVVGGEPTSSCQTVFDGAAVVGYRCTYTASLTSNNAPLNVAGLVDTLNNLLGDAGSIDSSSATVVELWGGAGHKGKNETISYPGGKTKCKGGDGGNRGYAQTILTVQGLENLGSNGDLYLYVGRDGQDDQDSASSSVLIGQNITNQAVKDNLEDPSAANVIGIAAGGAGGGKATDQGGDICYGGYRGGNGGQAVAGTGGDKSGAGAAGSNGNAGNGGDDGTGGSGHNDGADGIGGFGAGNDTANWPDSGVSSSSWPHGQGGEGQDGKAGSGGGGYGGGGGGKTANHNGGGGGGASWARQATVSSSSLNSNLILGSSYDPGYPAIVLTFRVSPNE